MLCIFNPEHDLCLANGNRHYVPPLSAREFAASACGLMRCVYPLALCLPAAAVGEAYRPSGDEEVIVPWGWNVTLKYDLLRQGVPERLLPSDDTLSRWRRLQHRTTFLPLQPDSHAVTKAGEVDELLRSYPDVVLKAPWSGSGRGLRWVSHRLSDHDRAWLCKVVGEQNCVIAEPRWSVQYDFALEYRVESDVLTFVGFSLFESANGVYRSNCLLADDTICRLVGFTASQRVVLESWLTDNIVPHYRGPLGVDCILDKEGRCHISEINLRHTMGLVAHEYLRRNPHLEGQSFSPTNFVG